MTTIAWDRETVACDSQSTADNVKILSTKKMHWNRSWIFIRCGSACFSVPVAEWFLSGGNYEKAPTVGSEELFGVGICRRTGKVWLFEGPTLAPIQLNEPKYAIGSGGHLALGAMAAGKTPAQAVAIAAKHCVYTGGKICSMKIRR